MTWRLISRLAYFRLSSTFGIVLHARCQSVDALNLNGLLITTRQLIASDGLSSLIGTSCNTVSLTNSRCELLIVFTRCSRNCPIRTLAIAFRKLQSLPLSRVSVHLPKLRFNLSFVSFLKRVTANCSRTLTLRMKVFLDFFMLISSVGFLSWRFLAQRSFLFFLQTDALFNWMFPIGK